MNITRTTSKEFKRY
nr:unnamed protein product [Callosobruchus analis]